MLDKIKKILNESPGLKAKEIANKINAQRKEVNSFLYKNLDKFVKDDNHFWSIVEPSEVDPLDSKPAVFHIKLDGNQWVDCDSFENSLINAGSPFESNPLSVVFTIPKGCKILIDAAARLLALCNQLVLSKEVTIDFSDCMQTLFFFDRIGFIGHLNIDVTVLPYRPQPSKALTYRGGSKTIVEVGEVDPSKDNKELINQLSDRFVQQSDPSYETAASTLFAELICNIKDHSETPIPGFAALQKYQPSPHMAHIQAVVSDSGLGIANTLRPSLEEHHPKLFNLYKEESIESDVGLVKTVLSKGGVSRFGIGRGLGFESSSKQAIKFNAKLSVRQEHFSLDFIYKDGELSEVIEKPNLTKIMGTHLCFDFSVDSNS